MSKICGYSCEHNKSGVCQISVCDKKSIISDKTEIQTLRLDELDYTIIPNSDIKPLLDRLQQENKILKENAENNDKVVDKVNWENQLLKKENEQLKAINKEYERLNKVNNRGFKITNVKEYDIDELLSYKKYKDNWNKLKEYIKEDYGFYDKLIAPEYGCAMGALSRIKDKMHELEQGSDSNEL